MNLTEEYWWKINLELKLRRSAGNSFQEFFSVVMGKLHGDDFVKVRPYGKKGDKGCDGYLSSSGALFQCYGALNGHQGKVDYLISKMEEDFATAKEKLSTIMKEWHMVHNLVDGLPVEAVETLNKLEKENPSIKFGFVGLEGFEERIGQLGDEQKAELLGPVATNKDAQDLQVTELKELIDSVIKATEETTELPDGIAPVPVDKLEANDLPNHWKQLIAGGWQNAHVVVAYIDGHPEPLVGEKIAKVFNDRYQYLKAQHLTPTVIMEALYEFVTGSGSVPATRQVAAQALLAHLFESCDIFESVPQKGVGE